MVLVSPDLKPQACHEFEADIYVLFHNKFICRGFQTVIHVGNVRQTAIITKMSKVCVNVYSNYNKLHIFYILCKICPLHAMQDLSFTDMYVFT